MLTPAARGKTLLTVVHNTRVLLLLADREIGLSHGRLAFDLPLAAVSEATLAALYRNHAAPEPMRSPATHRAALGAG